MHELSPTALNLFLECPRCFWLDRNAKIKRPRGAFPSLPEGIDRVLKCYFDRYRQEGSLPPELQGRLSGRLYPDLQQLERWRDWRRGLRYENPLQGVTLRGALDDCLIEDGHHVPLDFKTRGSAPTDDTQGYYRNQLDCYSFLLREQGLVIHPWGYLIFYYPDQVEEHGTIRFAVEPVRVPTHPERAFQTLRRAGQLLGGPLPARSDTCEYCAMEDRAAAVVPTAKVLRGA